MSGAVIVSTPQDLALIDAKKGIEMFKKVNVPILGMIENMSSFICPYCTNETHIFGSEGVKIEAKNQIVDFLGSLPLEVGLRESSDSGRPIVYYSNESMVSKKFIDIAIMITNKTRNVSKIKKPNIIIN